MSSRTLLQLYLPQHPVNADRVRRTIERLNLETVLVTFNPERFAGTGIQHIIGVPKDEAAIGAIAGLYLETHGIAPDGVVSLNDFMTLPAAQLARRFSLRHTSPLAAATKRSKIRQRAQLKTSLARHIPRFATFTHGDRESVHKAIERVGYPCILKCPSGQLPLGHVPIPSWDDVGRAIHHYDLIRTEISRTWSPYVYGEEGLVEELIPGNEHSVHGLVTCDGRVITFAVTDRRIRPGARETDILWQPSTILTAERRRELRDIAVRAARELGLCGVVFHVDFIVPFDGPPMILEVGGRPTGETLLSHHIPNVLRIQPLELLYRTAVLGDPLDEVPDDYTDANHGRWSGTVRIVAPRAGIITSIDGLDDLRQELGAENVLQVGRVGDNVTPTADGLARLLLSDVVVSGELGTDPEGVLQSYRERVTFSVD